MRTPCPACPDGNEWSTEGPTGRTCPVCKGKSYIGSDVMLCSRVNRADSWDVDQDSGISDMDDSPYCECGEDPIEEESATGHCFACGKELI